MRLFEKHRSVRTKGYEIYKKKVFLIDQDIWKIHQTEFCTFLYPEKEEGDLLVATYSSANQLLVYLPYYIRLAEKEELITWFEEHYPNGKEES